MSYLEQQLKKLEEIARNPNLNGGVYTSFSLFLSISDDLIEKKGVSKSSATSLGISDEILAKELESIRREMAQLQEENQHQKEILQTWRQRLETALTSLK